MFWPKHVLFSLANAFVHCTRGGGFGGFTGCGFGLGFRDLRLKRTVFRVLRCGAGCGFGQFLCSDFGYCSLKIPILQVFEFIQSLLPTEIEKPASNA